MKRHTPNASPTGQTPSNSSSSAVGRLIRIPLRLAKSPVGILVAYLAAAGAAFYAFSQVPELHELPVPLRIALVAALPVLALFFSTIPSLLEERRKKFPDAVQGSARKGYFRLEPREDEKIFTRADGVHHQVLKWMAQRTDLVMVLTGVSGAGKTSLLNAWVVPKLQRGGTTVIRLRGHQNLVAELEEQLVKPGQLAVAGDVRSLLQEGCRHASSGKVLVVIDQFEEFVILQDSERQEPFLSLLALLAQQPIDCLTFLLVLRSDYIGLLEKLELPMLRQGTTWTDVPPFTDSAARKFLSEGELQASPKSLAEALREAVEIEQTEGLIRPVTINLCGLALSHFGTSLPRRFRHGGLIRGFLRNSVTAPVAYDIAPRILPLLITDHVTKRPRSVDQLAKSTGMAHADIRACLRALGQADRAIVRPVDEHQSVWEISHDSLVAPLDSILTGWSVPVSRRIRPWTPWVAAILLAGLTLFGANWRKDPASKLAGMGWQMQQGSGRINLVTDRMPLTKSVPALQALQSPLQIKVENVQLTGAQTIDVSPLKDLPSLVSLDLSGTQVIDVSSLQDLKSLTALDLAGTKVRDVTPLKDLTGLTSLSLAGTQVGDVAPLKDLRNLTSLELSNTKVSDITPLKDLTNLTTLSLAVTQGVSDATPLKDLKNLTTLNLANTSITNVSPLKDLTNLSSLNLSNTQVTDVSSLKGLTGLTLLNLAGTPVTDVSALKDLKGLEIRR